MWRLSVHIRLIFVFVTRNCYPRYRANSMTLVTFSIHQGFSCPIINPFWNSHGGRLVGNRLMSSVIRHLSLVDWPINCLELALSLLELLFSDTIWWVQIITSHLLTIIFSMHWRLPLIRIASIVVDSNTLIDHLSRIGLLQTIELRLGIFHISLHLFFL